MLSFPPDWTFYFQIVLILALWFFLRRFLFTPTLAVLKDREQRSKGAVEEAARITAEAEGVGEQYRTQLADTRRTTTQQVDAIYRETEEEARQLNEAAQAEAARTLASMREILGKELEGARVELQGRVTDFAQGITEKLLGRPLT